MELKSPGLAAHKGPRGRNSRMQFLPQDPDFDHRVRDSFARQPFMEHIGARLTRVEPGLCEIELPYNSVLTQQHGFFHAGATGSIADSAGGYAAYTLMPENASVLSVEYKLNLIARADGEILRAVGRVVKVGSYVFHKRLSSQR